MPSFRLKRLIVGEPLANFEAGHERIPKWKALSTLSSDALSSSAYATDAILITLSAFSASAVIWSIPIALLITALLAILTLSYRQTIEAYPNGGGAYTVAKENLGEMPGLVAGAALLIDYVLTVSVSVAAGVENIASAFPYLLQHQVAFCGIVILLVMMINLRGVRESTTIFAFPTYFFVFSIFLLVGTGLYRVATGDALVAAPIVTARQAYPVVPLVLVLRAFASGCAALTGVEAISNSVPVFREPTQRNAKITLIWMSLLLGGLFVGITVLAHVLQIVPHEDQTLVSLLGRAVFGEGPMYYALQISTAIILFLAANTSYAGFPRLASLLAHDRYLPRQFGSVGDRLVFSNAIIWLSLFAFGMIAFFRAETLSILPLYALGVFTSFTLSQSGMVAHHFRGRKSGWLRSMLINLVGAITTLVVLLDIAFAKFTHGAWIILLAIPLYISMFKKIQKHYLAVGRELSLEGKTPKAPRRIKHTVIIPVSGVHQGVIEAAEYARSISDDVRACYVELDAEVTARVQVQWEKWIPGIPFVVLKSPYRSVIEPLVRYVDDVEQIAGDDLVTVVIPEFVTAKWWHQLLHNHTAIFIRAALTFRRGKVVTSVRYHIRGF